MDTCPAYYAPLNKYESTWNHKLYQESVKQFEDRQYRQSFRTLMNAINQVQTEKCEKGSDRWVLPHGSLIVEISLTEDAIEVRAPFIKLPEKRRAPILRQIWELNTRSLTLGLIKLDGDDLNFHFSTPLDLADPFKVYSILHEICITGDSHDDVFVDEFGATPLGDKDVTPLPAEQVDRGWEIYRAMLDEALRYDEYFTGKRLHGFSYDVLGIALMQIDCVIAPQGYMRAKLERSTSYLWERRPMDEVVAQLRKEVHFFQAFEREKFGQDLYRSTFFVGDRKNAEIQTCQKVMGERHDWARQDKSQRNHRGVVLNYLFACYHLMYSFYLPEKLHAELHDTLKACSGQPWEAAEELAWSSFTKIMDPTFA